MMRGGVEIARVHLVCLILSAVGSLYVARWMQNSITVPLKKLAQVAHSVSRQRTLAMRVPEADIAELHELGQDFNSLLDRAGGLAGPPTTGERQPAASGHS